jgi:hypothetical protein
VIGARHARSFRSGRQEDAHEYLVGLLDAMHEGVLAGLHPRPPRETAETSFIYRIFGGRLRSQARPPRRAAPAAGHGAARRLKQRLPAFMRLDCVQ